MQVVHAFMARKKTEQKVALRRALAQSQVCSQAISERSSQCDGHTLLRVPNPGCACTELHQHNTITRLQGSLQAGQRYTSFMAASWTCTWAEPSEKDKKLNTKYPFWDVPK